jgi:hypothetical protein
MVNTKSLPFRGGGRGRSWPHCRRTPAKKGIVMAGKYTPLENYLRDLPERQREVMLRFEEIERILISKLPSSAYEQSWWDHETEGNHRNTRAWANAGWKVESVDFNRKLARLVRI